MRGVSFPQSELERAHAVMGLDGLLRPKGSEEQTSGGTGATVSRFCREAGLSRGAERALIRRTLFWGALSAVTLGVTSNPILVLLPICLSVKEPLGAVRKRRERIERFDKDFAAFLLSLASSVRTGLDPLNALTLSGETFSEDSEVRAQIHEVKLALDGGDSEDKAIRAFGAHIAHPDINLFTTALILSRREGASIGDSLERLAKVTRQRQSFRRKIRTALAMQKLSAFGIALSAIALTLIQVGTNPEAVTTALQHPIGQKALLLGGGFMAIGLFWMARMARAKV